MTYPSHVILRTACKWMSVWILKFNITSFCIFWDMIVMCTFVVAVWHKIHFTISVWTIKSRGHYCSWELARNLCRMYINFARFEVSEVLMSTMKVFSVVALSNWATGSQSLEAMYHLQSSRAPQPLCVKVVDTFRTLGISDPDSQDNSLEEWIVYEICWHWNVCVVVNIVTWLCCWWFLFWW